MQGTFAQINDVGMHLFFGFDDLIFDTRRMNPTIAQKGFQRNTGDLSAHGIKAGDEH